MLRCCFMKLLCKSCSLRCLSVVSACNEQCESFIRALKFSEEFSKLLNAPQRKLLPLLNILRDLNVICLLCRIVCVSCLRHDGIHFSIMLELVRMTLTRRISDVGRGIRCRKPPHVNHKSNVNYTGRWTLNEDRKVFADA